MIKIFKNIFIILSISILFIGCEEPENNEPQEIITVQDDTAINQDDTTTNQNDMKWDSNNWDNSNWH